MAVGLDRTYSPTRETRARCFAALIKELSGEAFPLAYPSVCLPASSGHPGSGSQSHPALTPRHGRREVKLRQSGLQGRDTGTPRSREGPRATDGLQPCPACSAGTRPGGVPLRGRRREPRHRDRKGRGQGAGPEQPGCPWGRGNPPSHSPGRAGGCLRLPDGSRGSKRTHLGEPRTPPQRQVGPGPGRDSGQSCPAPSGRQAPPPGTPRSRPGVWPPRPARLRGAR